VNASASPRNTTNLIAFNIPSSDPAATRRRTFARSRYRLSGSMRQLLFRPKQPVIIDGYTQPGASPNALATGDNAVVLIKIIGQPNGDWLIQLCSPSG